MWNLIKKNKDTNELIYKTETDLQILRTNLWLPKGECGINQELGMNTHTHTHTHTTIYKIDNQEGPTVQHRELYSVFCDNLYEKRILKRLSIRITESLCCTPETNTTL